MAAIDKLNDVGRRLANNRAEFGFEIFQSPGEGSIDHVQLPPFSRCDSAARRARHALITSAQSFGFSTTRGSRVGSM
jgi:hypothetical protein